MQAKKAQLRSSVVCLRAQSQTKLVSKKFLDNDIYHAARAALKEAM